MNNKSRKKFSVLLPVRNGGEYIKECVKSILSQTVDNYNIIVLDSLSTDGTIEWIESLKNDRIVLYKSNENLTIEQNWGRIKEVPKNEFMTMIGHDDILHSNYLEEMNKLIAKYPHASLYQTHFTYIDENGTFLRNCVPMSEKQFAHEFLASQMTRKIDSTGTGFMMRSMDFEKLGGMPGHYPNLIFADFHLWVSLMLLGYMATSPSQCFSYRIHKSLSRTTNGMAYQAALMEYVKFLINLKRTNKDINDAIRTNGKEFLLYYCKAMSHRLLKTSIDQRTISVSDFINSCKKIAEEFIPGQQFQPNKSVAIKAAEVIDKISFLRRLFLYFRGMR
jgi:glycosyltransferase involved in cell wall biosynthesis